MKFKHLLLLVLGLSLFGIHLYNKPSSDDRFASKKLSDNQDRTINFNSDIPPEDKHKSSSGTPRNLIEPPSTNLTEPSLNLDDSFYKVDEVFYRGTEISWSLKHEGIPLRGIQIFEKSKRVLPLPPEGDHTLDEQSIVLAAESLLKSRDCEVLDIKRPKKIWMFRDLAMAPEAAHSVDIHAICQHTRVQQSLIFRDPDLRSLNEIKTE